MLARQVLARQHDHFGKSPSVDSPLAAFHFEAFRQLVGDEFEVRKGPGPNDVKFRPRLAMTTTPWPYKSWTRAHLVGSLTRPRLGRQSFVDPELCEQRPGHEPHAGEVLIMAAFQEEQSGSDPSRLGRWWLKDNIACDRRKSTFHLATREALPAAEFAEKLRQRLRQAAADEGRYPKVP